jgi:hypothetical protein
MHPRCLHRISEVGGEEGLRAVWTVVNLNRVVSQRDSHDVGDRAENRELLFAKEVDCAVIAVSSAKAKIGVTYGLGFLSAPLWYLRMTSIASRSRSPGVGF